jgi:hypothetical protein
MTRKRKTGVTTSRLAPRRFDTSVKPPPRSSRIEAAVRLAQSVHGFPYGYAYQSWSCRTAKRFGEGALGNLFDGSFARMAAPAPCTYDICPCSVPANRGMIE